MSPNLLISHRESENDSTLPLTTLLRSSWIFLYSGESRSSFSLYTTSCCRSFRSLYVWMNKTDAVIYSEKAVNTGIVIWEWTHIDDDIMAFIFQSHAELELCVVDEVHILLQHLQIMGKHVEVHVGMGRGNWAGLLQHPNWCTDTGALFLCRMSTTLWKPMGDLFLV